MWTTYLQDQSSSDKLLVGEGSGGRKEDALAAVTGPPEPGGSVQCEGRGGSWPQLVQLPCGRTSSSGSV